MNWIGKQRAAGVLAMCLALGLAGCGGAGETKEDPELANAREQVRLYEAFQAFVRQHEFPKTYEEETGFTKEPIWGHGFTEKKWLNYTEAIRKADTRKQAPIEFLFDGPERDKLLSFLEERQKHHQGDAAYAKAIETLKAMKPVPRETDTDYPQQGPLTEPLP